MISPGILSGPGGFLVAMASSSAVKMAVAKDSVSSVASIRAGCVGNSSSTMRFVISVSSLGSGPEFRGHILVTNSPRVPVHLLA